MPQPFRILRVFAAFVILTCLLPLFARAGTWVAFQNSYTRSAGAPATVTTTFTLLNPATQYTLRAFNGGLQDDTTELVSGCLVLVNGVQVIGPGNFNKNVSELDVPVTLLASNTISVQVKGKPGGVLAIEIIGVDNDPPTITASLSPAPNAAGWNNSPVTVTFTCSDKTSGVASCPAPVNVSTEGANQVVSGTATDLAGNSATTSVTINLDMTPPTIRGTINPPPDSGGYNSGPVTVTFTCADALSGVASCSPAVSVTTEGTFQETGTAVDVAGNTATTTVTVNISFNYFKIRSWQVNPPGDPLITGKCLDYGATVFLNDCASAHPIRVFEIGATPPCSTTNPPTCTPPPPQIGHGGMPLYHEVMLFAGNQVIGIQIPQTPPPQIGPPQPITEFQLELQAPFATPAQQIWRLDGDSIILEGSHLEFLTNRVLPTWVEVPGPCINTVLTTPPYCPDPPPQLVIQVQNARGANSSPLVAAVRNLADNEFWDFIPGSASPPYPTTGFVSTVVPTAGAAPVPITTADTLSLALSNAVWGSVILFSTPTDCRVTDPLAPGTPQDIGGCIDVSAYSPLPLGAGVTIRGNRRGTNFGPQLYAAYTATTSHDCDSTCMLEVLGDYARVTGLRVRGQTRSTNTLQDALRKNDGIWINYAGKDAGPPCVPLPGNSTAPPCLPQLPFFPLATITQLIATVDHNDMSDWSDAAVTTYAPFFNDSNNSNKCGYNYPGYSTYQTSIMPPDLYPCDQSTQTVPYSPYLVSANPNLTNVSIAEDPIAGTGTGTLANVHVARNFLHHNLADEGGYGVGVQGRAFVEANTFDWNRHDITANAEPHYEYRASHNLVLSSAANYSFGGNDQRLQDFDMHGTDWACCGFKGLFIGGAAGYYVEIDGNTFLGHDAGVGGAGRDYRLRGYPINSTYYHNNRSLRNEDQAMEWDHCFSSILGLFGCSAHFPDSDFLTHISVSGDNQFASSPSPYTNPTSQFGVGDFDGDGDDDLFLATGNTWLYSPGGQREWRYLNSAPDTIDQMLFGDFDGDGRTDVVGMRNGQLYVSWGGISAFDPLNSTVPPNCTMATMAVGDFNGVGRKTDIFCADGANWWISYGGNNTQFMQTGVSSNIPFQNLRFGHFAKCGSGVETDVFSVQSTGWYVSCGATTPWQPLGVALTNTANGLVVADFKGDGIADVAFPCGSAAWQIYYGDTQTLSACNTFASFSLVGGGVGRFNGGPGADILVWNGTDDKATGILVVPGGTGTPQPLSSQDMR